MLTVKKSIISIFLIASCTTIFYILKEEELATVQNNNTQSLSASIASKRRRLQVNLQEKLGRPYKPWDRSISPFPCVTDETKTADTGLIYIKVPKTSSSTLARITTRIAGREARRQGVAYTNTTTCKIASDPMIHHKAADLKVSARDKSKSFLWTIIRDPSSRAISHYGMRVKMGDVQLSDESFMNDLENNRGFLPNVQLGYLALQNTDTQNPSQYPEVVQGILNEYNFIGTYERLYESLVVLTMIIGVDVSDVLFDYLPMTLSRCGSLEQPSWLTSGMKEFLQSDRWRQRENGDYLLYDAVSHSLDMTIEALGRKNFEDTLQRFYNLIALGTDVGKSVYGKEDGCGIPKLHHLRGFPFADIEELPWFEKLTDEQKRVVYDARLHHIWYHGKSYIIRPPVPN